MIVYQVTVFIDSAIESEWQGWMLQKHIPDVMSTGSFLAFRFMKTVAPDTPEKAAYVIEYDCENMEKLKAYQASAGPLLQKEHSDRYAGRFTASRRIMMDI